MIRLTTFWILVIKQKFPSSRIIKFLSFNCYFTFRFWPLETYKKFIIFIRSRKSSKSNILHMDKNGTNLKWIERQNNHPSNSTWQQNGWAYTRSFLVLSAQNFWIQSLPQTDYIQNFKELLQYSDWSKYIHKGFYDIMSCAKFSCWSCVVKMLAYWSGTVTGFSTSATFKDDGT